jgi:hypothetical protein
MRWLRLLLVGIGFTTLSACGGSSPNPGPTAPPTSIATPSPPAGTAAEAAEPGERSCVVDSGTREALEFLSDELWNVGTRVGSDDASLGLRFYEASIAYGILAECRDVGTPPAASGSPQPGGDGTPVTCPDDPDVIAQLRDAWGKGTAIMIQLLMMGIDVEDLEPMAGLNHLLSQRATELEIACGLRPPDSPAPAATPGPESG